MPDEKPVTEGDVYKAIGHLDEATKVLREEAKDAARDQDQVIGFFTALGRILKAVFEK